MGKIIQKPLYAQFCIETKSAIKYEFCLNGGKEGIDKIAFTIATFLQRKVKKQLNVVKYVTLIPSNSMKWVFFHFLWPQNPLKSKVSFEELISDQRLSSQHSLILLQPLMHYTSTPKDKQQLFRRKNSASEWRRIEPYLGFLTGFIPKRFNAEKRLIFRTRERQWLGLGRT